ncbi:hypothetical protein CW664_11000 [Macrococcoides caseolyticum]|uniref:hypothetical protein n=2 Tax=Macrococcoides caseolyticum TaxID=69966 RepID=UPI000C32C66F|nr:hypothetical protein [Macrococcus caseolyticus]PKE23228.1 hypothetical protein CW689_10050 [Macrococcus caseolyticus]PKF44417.1 hypothetical protein CW664_11000 [Macrococcus caseolyticus]
MMETIDAIYLMITSLVLACGLIPTFIAISLINKLLFHSGLEWIDKKQVIKSSLLFILSTALLCLVLYIVNMVHLTPGVLKDIKNEEAIKMLLIITDYNKLLFKVLFVGTSAVIFLYSVVNLIVTVIRTINQRENNLENVFVKSLYEKDYNRIVTSYMNVKENNAKLKLNKNNTARLVDALVREKEYGEATYLLKKLENTKNRLITING